MALWLPRSAGKVSHSLGKLRKPWLLRDHQAAGAALNVGQGAEAAAFQFDSQGGATELGAREYSDTFGLRFTMIGRPNAVYAPERPLSVVTSYERDVLR